MTPIEIEQIVRQLQNKIDNLIKETTKKVNDTLEKLTNEVNRLKVEIEILKQGGNL